MDYKDLFITSGIYRRPNDLDYLSYVASPVIQASLAKGITRENLTLVDRMPRVPVPNHAFRNNGDLTFTNVTDGLGPRPTRVLERRRVRGPQQQRRARSRHQQDQRAGGDLQKRRA